MIKNKVAVTFYIVFHLAINLKKKNWPVSYEGYVDNLRGRKQRPNQLKYVRNKLVNLALIDF